MVKGSRSAYLVGEIFQTKFGASYTVIGYPENPRRRIIRFSTGETKDVLTSMIALGNIQSCYDKTLYGVGYIGNRQDATDKHPLYYRWTNMIGRCYSKAHSGYKSYGAKGVYVSPELHSFSNYIQVVSSLENYDSLLKRPKEWQIDKDLLSGCCYSPDTIKIIRSSNNLEVENQPRRTPVVMVDLSGNCVAKFPSITEAERTTGVYRGNISRAVRTGTKAGNFRWRFCVA